MIVEDTFGAGGVEKGYFDSDLHSDDEYDEVMRIWGMEPKELGPPRTWSATKIEGFTIGDDEMRREREFRSRHLSV